MLNPAEGTLRNTNPGAGGQTRSLVLAPPASAGTRRVALRHSPFAPATLVLEGISLQTGISASARLPGPYVVRHHVHYVTEVLSVSSTGRGHKTDTSETTRATSRDASPPPATARFAGESVSRVIDGK